MDLSVLQLSTQKLNQFNKKGIFTIEDLIHYYPRKYYDFRKTTLIRDAADNEYVAIIAKVTKISTDKGKLTLTLEDASEIIQTSFFGQTYLEKVFEVGKEYIFCGKLNYFETKTGFIVKYFQTLFHGPWAKTLQRMIPVYSKIEGMSDEFLRKTIQSALAIINKQDYLSPLERAKFNLITRNEALKLIHKPLSPTDIENAKKRIVFDDIYEYNLQLLKNRKRREKSAFEFKSTHLVQSLIKDAPFKYTEDQATAVKKILAKMHAGHVTNALVQGDVGCGKTMVAISLMVNALENGHQSVLLCPTAVLAKQHFEEIKRWSNTLGFSDQIGLLIGDMKKKEKEKTLQRIASGEIKIIVGTHSVIQKEVQYKNLALAVVDEEHRFGVEQREMLQEGVFEKIHSVSMSATPIPRSLAMTLYGDDIDVYTIKTMPNGRKPVNTTIETEREKAYEKIYEEIQKGFQAYVVCPLIEESENEKMTDVHSVEKSYKEMTDYFHKKHPEVRVMMVTGKMKEKEVDEAITKFKNKEAHILIGTTIIEVGVNVPNATVMIIKNAERFGLAQLHQLRGRVGRGGDQSYCILLTEDNTNEKVQAMCQTTDGFEIAQEDLRIRGCGDLVGIKQSGQNEQVLLMLAFPELNLEIKNLVRSKHSYLEQT